jgi:hypothetical protein
MTRKKLVNAEAHGSISVDSRSVWKQDLARSNASCFASSFPLVNAHAVKTEGINDADWDKWEVPGIAQIINHTHRL